MKRHSLAALTVLLICAAALDAQTRDEKVRQDRRDVTATGQWIYNDLVKAMAAADKAKKPLLVTIRCIP